MCRPGVARTVSARRTKEITGIATPSANARKVNSRRVICPARSASCSAANGPFGVVSVIAGLLLSFEPLHPWCIDPSFSTGWPHCHRQGGIVPKVVRSQYGLFGKTMSRQDGKTASRQDA
jgi:hypothetical protein